MQFDLEILIVIVVLTEIETYNDNGWMYYSSLFYFTNLVFNLGYRRITVIIDSGQS